MIARALIKNKNNILKSWDLVFLALLLSLASYFLYGGMGFPSLHSLSEEKLFLRACSLTLVVGILLSAKEMVKENWHRKLIILFVLFELLYGLWHFSFFSFKKMFIDTSLFFMFFYSIPRTRSLAWLNKVNWTVMAILGLLVLPIWGSFFSMWHLDKTYRGGFIHRNELGYFLVVLLIFFSQLKLNRKLKFSFFLVYFIFLSMCCSRSTLLSSLAVMGFYFISLRKIRLFSLMLAAHVSIALSWKYGLVSLISGKLIKMSNEARVFETSTSERWQLIQNGIKAYSENPIMGKGYIFLSDTTFNKGLDVNNFYLSHLISYGIFPSIVVAFLFAGFFRDSKLRVKLMLINLAVFAAFQAFFDYFQSSYFYITILIIYLFNYLDYEEVEKRSDNFA
jgi:hypothetical protein